MVSNTMVETGTDEVIDAGVGETHGGARPPVDGSEIDRSCGLRQRNAPECGQTQQRVDLAAQGSTTAEAEG